VYTVLHYRLKSWVRVLSFYLRQTQQNSCMFSMVSFLHSFLSQFNPIVLITLFFWLTSFTFTLFLLFQLLFFLIFVLSFFYLRVFILFTSFFLSVPFFSLSLFLSYCFSSFFLYLGWEMVVKMCDHTRLDKYSTVKVGGWVYTGQATGTLLCEHTKLLNLSAPITTRSHSHRNVIHRHTNIYFSHATNKIFLYTYKTFMILRYMHTILCNIQYIKIQKNIS
jgi:hypothetical protein